MRAFWIGCVVLYVSRAVLAGVTVTPVQVVETRQKELAPDQGMGTGHVSGLTVRIRLDGPEVKNATKYGKVKITEATDDAGTNLRARGKTSFMGPEMDEFEPFRFQSGTVMHFGNTASVVPASTRDVELSVGLPARSAKKIVVLRGELQVLAGVGQAKTVPVKNPQAMAGKALTDPVLKQAGVTVKVLDAKAAAGAYGMPADMPVMGNNAPSVTVQISGNAIEWVNVVDASGEKVSSGSCSTTKDNVKTETIELSQPLNATMTLELGVSVGQKAITVPFELKDIDLP